MTVERATQLVDFWYAIARSGDLRSTPLERRVCGRALVVFRDDRGQARALDATCPHRGANLADGRVVDGTIACPYHGWQFDGGGRCTRIPANGGKPAGAGFKTTSFPTLEQQGMIWTCLGTPVAPPPRFEAFDDPDLRSFCCELVAPVPFDWWVENALDFEHLPFVHPETIGGDDSALGDFELERRDDHLGFVARASGTPRSFVARALRLEMRVAVTLFMPGVTLFDIDLGRGRRQVILAIATPEDDRTTRVWNFSLRSFLRAVPFGDTVGAWFLRRVLAEDVALGKRAYWGVNVDRKGMLSSRGDELSLEFLRLLRLWRNGDRVTLVK